MFIHIPHSSIHIVDSSQYVGDLTNDFNLLTDWFTDELFDYECYEKFVVPYSRLWCDVERFRDDLQEPMAKYGHGVVYTHGATENRIRNVSQEEIERIKTDYYDAHHNHMAKSINHALGLFNSVIIVDCHSFHPTALMHEVPGERPDFCIGYDDFHGDLQLVNLVVEYLQIQGFSVEVNYPFSGSFVPKHHFNKNENVKSIMIEVDRQLYTKKTDVRAKNKQFPRIKQHITNVLNIIDTYEEQMG